MQEENQYNEDNNLQSESAKPRTDWTSIIIKSTKGEFNTACGGIDESLDVSDYRESLCGTSELISTVPYEGDGNSGKAIHKWHDNMYPLHEKLKSQLDGTEIHYVTFDCDFGTFAIQNEANAKTIITAYAYHHQMSYNEIYAFEEFIGLSNLFNFELNDIIIGKEDNYELSSMQGYVNTYTF